MSFILRAFVVVGLLTFLALRDDGTIRTKSETLDPVSTLSRALSEPEVRALDRLVRDAAEDGIRRVAGSAFSRDTLSEADRQPSWRGSSGR